MKKKILNFLKREKFVEVLLDTAKYVVTSGVISGIINWDIPIGGLIALCVLAGVLIYTGLYIDSKISK